MGAPFAGLGDAGAARRRRPASQEALTATIPSPEKLSSPKPGWGSWWSAMKKTGLAMPQPIVPSSSKWRRQPRGASSAS